MVREKSTPVAAPAHSQTQCALLSMLPPELRANIWELVLHIEPAVDGTVALQYRPDSSSASRAPSVLTLLETCRAILREASGIFYNMNHLKLRGAHWKSAPGITFFDSVCSPGRLSRIKHLTVEKGSQTDLVEITVVCKTIRNSLSRLESLQFSFGMPMGLEDKFERRMQSERYFLKKAVAKFSGSLKVFLVELSVPARWTGSCIRRASEVVVDAASTLPNLEKVEVVRRIETGMDGA